MTRPANRPSPAGTTSTKTPPAGPRRWPDLLIGLLVLLLLGGFGALLFKPQRAASTAATPATIPAAPTQETSPSAASPTTTANSNQGASPDNAATQTNTATSQEPPTIAATPVQAQPTTPPATSVKPPSAADTQGTSQQTASEAPNAALPASGSTTTSPSTPAAPRSGGAVATSASRVPLRSDYRISLGVFQTAKTVRTQTAAVAGLGYTVYPINISNGFVAQVGPFADEATALQALADIQRAYPAARMYRPKGVTGASGSTTSTSAATPDTGAGNPASSAAPANTAAPAASSGLTYLQVGAFDKVETAQRLVERLRTLGYSPTVNAPAGRKVTVWVGPFSGGALSRTEDRLTQNGLDHFRVQ